MRGQPRLDMVRNERLYELLDAGGALMAGSTRFGRRGWVAELGIAPRTRVLWRASSAHWPHSEGSVFLLETCVQAGIACRRRLLGHDPTLDMDRRACVGGLAWMMPATEWLDGSKTIATARRNTIYHNECRPGGVGFDQQQQDSRCVDAVARSNGRGGMPPYAVLPRATHVDRRRRVSGAALVEAGYMEEATWRLLGRLLGQEQ